jgi:hypothetical protein
MTRTNAIEPLLLPWMTTMNQPATSAASAESASTLLLVHQLFPATIAVDSLKYQQSSRKRPRQSMMESSLLTFTDLFDAVSANEKFPKIEWPADDDEADQTQQQQEREQHADDDNLAKSIVAKQSSLTLSSLSQTNNLRRAANSCWSTNSLPRTSKTRVMSGLCTLDKTMQKAKTQVDLQDYCCQRDISFDCPLSAALNSFDQVLEAYKYMSFPKVTLVSE